MASPHGASTAVRLDSVHSAAPEIVASARLTVDTRGEGLIEITRRGQGRTNLYKLGYVVQKASKKARPRIS